MSQIRSIAQYFPLGTCINLKLQGNCATLIPPDKIIIGDDEVLNPEFTKQGSDEWLENRKKGVITGSTANAALGLDTVKKQKEHFKYYITKSKQLHFCQIWKECLNMEKKMR